MDLFVLSQAIVWFARVLIYIFAFYVCYQIFSVLWPWRSFQLYRTEVAGKAARIPSVILRLLLISTRGGKQEWKRQLLRQSGIRLPYAYYELARRFVVFTAILLGTIGWLAYRHKMEPFGVYWLLLVMAAACALVILIFDKPVLQSLKNKRQQAVVKEVYVVSKQLLYFNGTGKSLHYQLMRCIPLTKAIRHELYMLTTEWYQDAGKAIADFKERLATDEGSSFAETLNSLRLHQHENYYELLRSRILDYKEQMDLLRESRKELTSYLLFILAGIPLINTFRVFIYPWVSEGQKLFNSLS